MAKFFFTCIILTTVLFTYTVDAQELGLMRKAANITIAVKTQYPVGDPLPAGTYSIGSGGYFSTIDSAFNKLSTDGVAGNVTLELIDDLYTAMGIQYGFILIGPIPGAGSNSRVTIRPAANKNVTIQGNNECLLLFLNTSYLTMDGISTSGPTTLTIHTLSDTAYAYNDGVEFINNCDHNAVQNIIFIQDDINRVSSSVVCAGSGSDLPDSNLIQDNFVKKSGSDIGFMGSSLTSMCKGNIVRGNRIGSESDSLISWGVFLILCENTLVEDNIIQNLNTPIAGEMFTSGILVASCWHSVIRNNVIYNISTEAMPIAAGIALYGVYGNGLNNTIYNNMIYNINSQATHPDTRVAGIHLWNESIPKVYYNTVYLSGSGASKLGSAALYMYNGVSNADIKNNILINTRDESTYCASSIYDYTAANLISDYNDLFYDDTNANNCMVRISSTNYHTLADWQATGKDIHSITEMPNFIASHLHINEAIATNLEKGATPISGIDKDIDGDTRHASTPDIGADEFNGIVVPVELISFSANSNGREVLLSWSTATEINNYGFEVQRSLNEKDFFTMGFVSGNGTTTEQQNYSYTDKNLLEGKNYYRLKQLDYGGSFEYSDVIEVEWRAFDTYLLEQNYPNPFNPTTIIGYGIKEKTRVRLTVINTIGEEVAELVNEEKESGYHTVEFNAAKMPSGVYFYQLKAGEYSALKKMLLLK